MAIAFNLPSNEDTDARYELLNRLLLELCELLQTIVTARPSETTTPRVRPVSDSALPIRIPDLLIGGPSQRVRRRICSVQTPPASPSCSSQYLTRTFSDAFDVVDQSEPEHSIDYFGDDDDEVFCGGSTTSIPNVNRPSLLPRLRRRRRKSSGARESKKRKQPRSDEQQNQQNQQNQQHQQNQQNQQHQQNQQNEQPPTERRQILAIDDQQPQSPPVVLKEDKKDRSLMSTLLSTSLGGSLWTAVVIVLGWKLIGTTKR